MQILFSVDQAAAVKLGVDAPSSTVQIEIDPASLSGAEREILGESLRDGHDATSLGGICPPTIEGVHARIADLISRREKDAAKMEDSALSILSRMGEDEPCTLYVDPDGRRGRYAKDVAEGVVAVPVVPHAYHLDRIRDEEVRNRYRARFEAASAERERRIAAAIPALQRQAQEIRDARLAREEEEEEAYQALYDRLPESLRARAGDGFARDAEVKRALLALASDDVGYTPAAVTWDYSELADHLSDAEYHALRRVETQAPDGAKVKALCVWSLGARDHAPDCCGEYCDCPHVREDIRMVAKVVWEVGSFRAEVYLDL